MVDWKVCKLEGVMCTSRGRGEVLQRQRVKNREGEIICTFWSVKFVCVGMDHGLGKCNALGR